VSFVEELLMEELSLSLRELTFFFLLSSWVWVWARRTAVDLASFLSCWERLL